MNADPYSITIRNAFQASAWPIPATLWDVPPDPNAVPPVPGTPHDLTGWQFMFTVKKNLGDPDNQAFYKDDNTHGGVDGKIGWTVPASVTLLAEAKSNYYWDVRVLIPGSAGPTQLFRGVIPVEFSVSQRLSPNS